MKSKNIGKKNENWIWLTFKGTGIYVKNKLIHPDFKQVYEKCYPHKLRALQNDFCLIETKTTMKFGRHVQKISIADEDFFTEGWWLIFSR